MAPPRGPFTWRMAYPRETGIRVSASFPAVIEPTHWDWSSRNPALPLRGLTRERLSALDAGPHDASSACCGPLDPLGRRSADRLTRLLPAGSELSRQDQTNLCHGAPRRSDDTEARSGLARFGGPPGPLFRVPPRLLQKYPLRILPLGSGLRGGRIPSRLRFEALEQAEASRNGGELRKGPLAIIPCPYRPRKSVNFVVDYELK